MKTTMIAGQAQTALNESYILGLRPQRMTVPTKITDSHFQLAYLFRMQLNKYASRHFCQREKNSITERLDKWHRIAGGSQRKGLVASVLPCAKGSGTQGWQESHHVECGSSELYGNYGKLSRKSTH